MIPNTKPAMIPEISLRSAALITGFSLLLMAILAPIANFAILESLIIPGDALTTVSNIEGAQGQFRMAIFLFLLVAILDIIVAWALFVLLKPVNREWSLLAAWFRLIYSGVLVISLGNHMNVLSLLGDDSAMGQIMLFLAAFNNEWALGLIIFGFHLLLVGYLAFRSGYINRWLGILVFIAGLGYVIDGLGAVLFANYDLNLAMFTFVGEVLLIFWCLWKGFKGLELKEKVASNL
ncbi:MAG: DUF4386 domain-containing protein [Candidatus Marinimicrobia bacterium]|nr:DUF4386 domain-containing protein [Candidatus Neomarinimicrobiota bacterium]MCF7903942.1 DUF4386 domain-containing protein [Candidatus Neomarinimicrobiota bacterium]